jgi:hypothetical protein
MSEFRVNNLSNESDTGGPTLSGITTFSSPYFFVPPVGSTRDRPDDPVIGDLRFNTDVLCLEYYKGDTIGWAQLTVSNQELNGGYRGVMGGGDDPSSQTNIIDYITISTLANAVDFGDLTDDREYLQMGPMASRTRCLFAGGQAFPSPNNEMDLIDYVTFSSTGNSTDFGDLVTTSNGGGGCSSQTRGVYAGGYDAPTGKKDTIQYVTMASTGNAVDFGGDLPAAVGNLAGISGATRGIFNSGSDDTNALSYITISTTGVDASDFGDSPYKSRSNQCTGGNAVRAVFAGGGTPSPGVNSMYYLTISTLGNGADFGDLTAETNGAGAVSSPTRMVVTGGKRANSFSVTCDYVEIMTLGNAKDFGDTTSARMCMAAGSNGHGGLG